MNLKDILDGDFEVKRLRIEKDDRLVLLTPHRLTNETRLTLKDALRRCFPGVRVLVLEEGMRLATVSNTEDVTNG